MARPDARAQLARDLAQINRQLAAISRDAPNLDFATRHELTAIRAGLDRARREVTAALLAIHADLSVRGDLDAR